MRQTAYYNILTSIAPAVVAATAAPAAASLVRTIFGKSFLNIQWLPIDLMGTIHC